MMDANTWNMILGKSGKLPGKLSPEIIDLAKSKKLEFYTGVPQDAYPNELDKYRKEMEENGWETGEDDEELLEFAMHETQYRDYKSGLAKTRFDDEIEKLRAQEPSTTLKTSNAVKEKQKPNRKNYSTESVNYPEAMIAYILYSLDKELTKKEPYLLPKHDIWNAIGYWRNLMTVKINFNEKQYEVEIKESQEKGLRFTIEQQTYEVEKLFIDAGEIDIKLFDNSFLATIGTTEDASKITINDDEFLMSRIDLLEGEQSINGDDDTLSTSENHILSPIPGRIFKINMKEGDKVEKGDVVLIIDAMKMENNITSKKEGIVEKLMVELDQMIEAGTPLVEIV